MSQPIDAAPKDGSTILIEDDAGAHDVARWSPEAATWIDKNGEPSKITASHWLPIPSETWSKASSAPDEVQRRSRGGFTILAIASVVLACFAAAPFRYEVSAFLTRQPSLHDASGEEGRLTQPISEPQFKADQDASDARPTRMAATALLSDAHQSPQTDDQSRRALDAERERSAALANELEVMRRELEARAAQLRRVTNDAKLQEQAAAGTISALRQSLQEERDKMAVRQKETSAVRQAMLADDQEHRRALDEARARYAALASELAGVRREIDTRAAPAPQAADPAEQRQALESTVAELRRSLQQEREKTATLQTEAATLRQTMTANTEQDQRALEGERERSAVLADELAALRRQSEQQASSSREAGEKIVQQRQALEGTVTELRQALQQERDKIATFEKQASAARQDDEEHRRALDEERVRRAALLSELAGAQREVETQAAQLRKATETMQLRQAEVTESATLLKQEREKTTALAHEVEDSRQGLNTRTAQGQGSFAEAPLETGTEPMQSRKASVETRQEAEAGASARLLEEKWERTATLPQEVVDAPQELKHQPWKPAREQRSSSLPRNPSKLSRGQSAKQSWRPLLWLWGLDPRWQRTMHASVFGGRLYRTGR
jgi:hypothetical protein